MGSDPLEDLRGGGQGHFFSEYGHVAYQIRANNTCSHMVANFLPTDTPSTPGRGSKGQTISFSESSRCISKERESGTDHQESKYAAVLTHTLDPWVGVKRSFFLFVAYHVAYQIKVKEV